MRLHKIFELIVQSSEIAGAEPQKLQKVCGANSEREFAGLK